MEQAMRQSLALPLNPTRSQMMRFAYREMLTPRMFRQVLAALGAIVALFTVIGPVGTYETLSPLRRLGYWSLCYFVAWPVFFCMAVVTLYLLRDRSPRAASLSLGGMALVAAVPATGIVLSIEQFMRPEYPAGFRIMYPKVVAMMLPATVLVHLIVLQRLRLHGIRPDALRSAGAMPGDDIRNDSHGGYSRANQAGTATLGTAPGAPAAQRVSEHIPQPVQRGVTPPATKPRSVFDRLPRRLGVDLIYLTVDDHYVKAHTSAGSAIILMRFADAVAELADQGLQVHRSFWVANRYLERLARKDGRTVLRLSNGQEIPVSRTYLTAVRAAVREVQ